MVISTSKVMFLNLNKDMTEDQLRDYAQPFGKVLEVEIHDGVLRSGKVTFSPVEEATDFMSKDHTGVCQGVKYAVSREDMEGEESSGRSPDYGGYGFPDPEGPSPTPPTPPVGYIGPDDPRR
ncbi:hypothetical protein WMY93_022393 [Mugilogobius chulae]|uniref:RRM domain-containing protein n=1 Tax=Mugilogobius chulae TaxID=88201 RepID=A0AAW0NDW4_9GOBI